MTQAGIQTKATEPTMSLPRLTLWLYSVQIRRIARAYGLPVSTLR